MELTTQKRQALNCIVEEVIKAATNAVDALNTADDTKAVAAVDALISEFLDGARRMHNIIAMEA